MVDEDRSTIEIQVFAMKTAANGDMTICEHRGETPECYDVLVRRSGCDPLEEFEDLDEDALAKTLEQVEKLYPDAPIENIP